MLTTLLFALEIKFVLKIEVMLGSLLGEFNGFFIIKQSRLLYLLNKNHISELRLKK